MARKRPNPEPSPPNGAERISVLNLKGSPEYQAWLVATSKATLIPTAMMVRDAIEKWARDRKLPPPPEI